MGVLKKLRVSDLIGVGGACALLVYTLSAMDNDPIQEEINGGFTGINSGNLWLE